MIDEFFRYDETLGLISYNYERHNYEIQLNHIKNAAVNIDNGVILMTTENNGLEKLVGYSIFGVFLFSNTAPEHYRFWYLSPEDLRIACLEKDGFAEKSGRSGWWFKINIVNGELIKDCWVY